MRNVHEPRPEFVERLALHIAAEVRHREHAARARWMRFVPQSPVKLAASMVAIVIASMILGGGLVVGAYQVQQNQQRAQLTAQYEQRVQLAKGRLAAASAQ